MNRYDTPEKLKLAIEEVMSAHDDDLCVVVFVSRASLRLHCVCDPHVDPDLPRLLRLFAKTMEAHEPDEVSYDRSNIRPTVEKN